MTDELDQMQEKMIAIVNADGEQILLRARIADDYSEQAAGFQYICPDVIRDTAILFVFNAAKKPVFHMNNVHASLDIAFIDEQGQIGDTQLMKEEFSTGNRRLYPSDTLSRYALEVREGFFSEHNIQPGKSWLKAYE